MAKNEFLVLALLSFFATGFCKRGKPLAIRALPGRIIMVPEFLKHCPNSSNKFLLDHIEFERFGTHLLINAECELSRRVNVNKVVLIMNNCEDSHVGTCQHFQTWRFGEESCSLLEKKDAFWSPIFQRIYPELHCPLLPGHYSIRNATLDVGLLRLLPLPLEKYYWRIQHTAYDYERWFCVEAGVRFMRTRL